MFLQCQLLPSGTAGTLALHLLLLTMCQFYEISVTHPKEEAHNRHCRIKTGASQADILRVLWTVMSHHPT
jgi:hypothetical protein